MRNIYTEDLFNVQVIDKLQRILRREGVERIADEPQGISEKVGRTFFVSSTSTRSNSANTGLEPLSPLATLQQALNACSANRGDVIYLMAGHAETISTAITTPAGAAGVSIVGLGRGRTRPVFTGATAATAHLFQISVNDVSVRNIVFAASTATATSQIKVTGADCEISDCEFDQGASDADSVFLDTGATRAYIHDSRWNITANGPVEHILINTTLDGVRIEDCRFHDGSTTNMCDTACIASASAHTNCSVKNVMTNFGMVLSFTSATSTGNIVDAYGGNLGTVGSQIRIGGCACYGGPVDGYLTRVADATVPQTNVQLLGTATGGRIRLIDIVGQVGTVIGAVANASKLIAHPQAGTDVDLCATADINGLAAAAFFALSPVATVGTAAVIPLAGGGSRASYAAYWLGSGANLRFSTAGNSVTGTMKWDIWWKPMDPGASFV